MAWTSVKTWATGDTLPASDLNTYLRDNMIWLHDRGADLASAATITPTTGFHKVTGTTTVDSIANPVNGNEMWLWFTGALTIRNNGGGTGNIRTSSGLDLLVGAETLVIFRSDGTVWKQVSAGAGGSAAYADSLLGADTATLDFQNIPAAIHLRMLIYARSTAATTNDAILATFNNDTGANYDWERFETESASFLGATDSIAASSISLGSSVAIPGANAPANTFGAAEMLVPHFAGTVNHKAALSDTGMKGSNASASVIRGGGIGFWRSTAAITRVTLATGGNFKAGSRASVYLFS